MDEEIERPQAGGTESEPKVEGMTPTESFVFTSLATILCSLAGVGLFGYKLWHLFPTGDIAGPFRQRSNNFGLFSIFTIDAAFWAFWTGVASCFLGFFIWQVAKALITGRLPPGFRRRCVR